MFSKAPLNGLARRIPRFSANKSLRATSSTVIEVVQQSLHPRRHHLHTHTRSSPTALRIPCSTFGRVLKEQNSTSSSRGWAVNTRRRSLHSSAVVRHIGIERPAPGTGLKVHFKDSTGNLIKTVEASEGDDILSIAHEYDVDLEGACEGSVACSTCHVILPEEYYNLLPEPEDDENDMLDMAFGLTDTSRLGCQVKLTKELDGMTCTLPAATRNMFVDGA
ncbi:2Fe-2S ferredoxin-type domain-containing protein [Gymnopilus junonius]|uniref:2Fe-2S ferredoxin-type domain-containing protein n=1 Tax=Gymnopilus junonius TaxID=109634 RepID=A0A9P5NIQ0_GYMJU|nr:2Fe-2S ferredoxin-type domain-containing protein [Gymnopilus junonius]